MLTFEGALDGNGAVSAADPIGMEGCPLRNGVAAAGVLVGNSAPLLLAGVVGDDNVSTSTTAVRGTMSGVPGLISLDCTVRYTTLPDDRSWGLGRPEAMLIPGTSKFETVSTTRTTIIAGSRREPMLGS
jgi:hypothetical protein